MDVGCQTKRSPVAYVHLRVCHIVNDQFTIQHYRFTFTQLLLCTVKIKVHIQALKKLCDWIPVCIRLLTQKTCVKYDTILRQLRITNLAIIRANCAIPTQCLHYFICFVIFKLKLCYFRLFAPLALLFVLSGNTFIQQKQLLTCSTKDSKLQIKNKRQHSWTTITKMQAASASDAIYDVDLVNMLHHWFVPVH